MSTKTIAKKLVKQLALTVAVGRVVPVQRRASIRLLARDIVRLNDQITRRCVEVESLKARLSQMVPYGKTQVPGYRVNKARVAGHPVKAYYCKAYDTLKVERSAL